MQDYLLFIDTETSGLPKNWNLPYSDNNNWPYAVQVAWIIYTKDKVEIKREDHYIKDNDFDISASAFKIHGITREFLDQQGEYRQDIMELLYQDLNEYQPLVVGHFIELDYHITGVDFYRVGMENPMNNLPMFCTMLGTKQFIRNPQVEHLRLSQLYSLLFEKVLHYQHNAMVDALATADCFFKLVQMGSVDDNKIAKQHAEREKRKQSVLKGGCGASVVIILILTLLITHWL